MPPVLIWLLLFVIKNILYLYYRLLVFKYIEYAFEELEKSEINGLIAFGEISGLLEEDEVPADKLELLRKYDALTGYVEVE